MKPLRPAVLLASLLCSPAFAHAMLLQSNPAAGSVGAAPGTISLTFTEEVLDGASFEVTRNGTTPVPLDMPVLAANHSVLTASPAAPLSAGKYVVSWHNTARDDGHQANGSFSFTVK